MAFTNIAGAIELNQYGKVGIHGFISQGYIKSNHNNFMADTEGDGTTQFNEAGINFTSDASERLRMGVQFLARDLGRMGNKDVTIDWAVADYSCSDWLNIRAGKIKSPHGLYNTERDVDMLRAFVFLPQSFYMEGWRDSLNASSGVSAYGYIPAGSAGNVTYSLFGGNGAMKTGGGEARFLEDQVPQNLQLKVLDFDTKNTWYTQLVWDSVFSLNGLKLVGGYWGHEFDANCSLVDGTATPTFTADMTQAGLIYNTTTSPFHVKMRTLTGSVEYILGDTQFAAEYCEIKYNPTLSLSPYLGIAGNQLKRDFTSQGYYASLTHRFTDWLQLGTYYSVYYCSKEDKHGDKAFAERTLASNQKFSRWRKDTCFVTRFDLTPNWILKLEAHYNDGTALLYSDDGNLASNGLTTEYDRYWMLYAAKLSYSF